MSVVYKDGRAENVKVAYIGGGSRGWAWMFMSDLAEAPDMSGSVDLYDIDFEAAKNNEIIGNKFSALPEAKSKWVYTAKKTIKEALTEADFVVISILPGTFDEMESDVLTNVNMPNIGQIPNLPLGAVVETNALFTSGEVRPVMAGPILEAIYPLITRIVGEQEMVAEGCFERDLNKIFNAFANDQLVRLPLDKAKQMFDEMIENTKEYLSMYPIEK